MLSSFVGKLVKIDMTTGLYLKGKIISCNENSIEFEDYKGRLVFVSIRDIISIREVEK